jgi:hypothetical protein
MKTMEHTSESLVLERLGQVLTMVWLFVKKIERV